jgi:hypothetical protein
MGACSQVASSVRLTVSMRHRSPVRMKNRVQMSLCLCSVIGAVGSSGKGVIPPKGAKPKAKWMASTVRHISGLVSKRQFRSSGKKREPHLLEAAAAMHLFRACWETWAAENGTRTRPGTKIKYVSGVRGRRSSLVSSAAPNFRMTRPYAASPESPERGRAIGLSQTAPQTEPAPSRTPFRDCAALPR